MGGFEWKLLLFIRVGGSAWNSAVLGVRAQRSHPCSSVAMRNLPALGRDGFAFAHKAAQFTNMVLLGGLPNTNLTAMCQLQAPPGKPFIYLADKGFSWVLLHTHALKPQLKTPYLVA